MKTAEDFRNDFGNTEESFRACVRQTLTALECKEEKPVKKKINMGLVLALAVLLLTGTAVADEQWGILSFLQSRGKNATEDQLLNLYEPVHYYPDGTVAEPISYGEYDLVDAVITEALHEDGTLYLAVTLTPLKEKTLVLPMPDPDMGKKPTYTNYDKLRTMNLGSLTMGEVMQDAAYGDVSVLDYAKANGFDYVVLMHNFYINLNSSQAHWSQDQFDGLQHAEYNLQKNGTLRFILEIGYRPNLAFADADRKDWASVGVQVWSYDVTADGKWLWGNDTSASAYFTLHDGREYLRSIPEDAHDIVGYIGAVESIMIAPYDEEHMGITVTVNERDYVMKEESTWMSGPDWVIMDAAGNRLCKVDGAPICDLSTLTDEEGNKYSIFHGLFPVEYMPKDNKITLRAENRKNYNIIYDEYTYTLMSDPAMTGEEE